MESPTHRIDCFKNHVALEIEWNNKDPFYDRDLNNFRLLFDLRAISERFWQILPGGLPIAPVKWRLSTSDYDATQRFLYPKSKKSQYR